MSDYLLRSIETFCVGRAEAEESFLVEAFVLDEEFQEVLHAPFHSPVLLLGRKGTGKTALLKFLQLRSKDGGVRCLYLKPDDIPLLEGVEDAEDTASIKRRAYQALVSAIAIKVGSELRGLLGRSDKKLFDKALVDGARSQDAVQACMHGLAAFGTTIADINFEKLIPETEDVQPTALRAAIRANFSKSEKAFLLFIDDVDQVAAMSNKRQINRIWGFILAAQKLTEELPNLKTIISLRTEVWAILERDEHGQRDQVDHVRRLIRRLDPTEQEIKNIITRRLQVIRGKVGLPDSGDLIGQFFEERTVLLPTSEEHQRHWGDFLTKSSRGRPRDALQLLSLLAEKSRLAGYTRISTSVVDSTASIYSSERVNDLVREYAPDCSVVREIVNSFKNLEFIVSTDDMRVHLITLPSLFGIHIRDRTIHRDNIADIFALWSFVHELGIWNPRVPDVREERKFRHILFDQNTNFVSESNWNEMQKVVWELHPAYRSHLLELKNSDKARTGISLSSFLRPKK